MGITHFLSATTVSRQNVGKIFLLPPWIVVTMQQTSKKNVFAVHTPITGFLYIKMDSNNAAEITRHAIPIQRQHVSTLTMNSSTATCKAGMNVTSSDKLQFKGHSQGYHILLDIFCFARLLCYMSLLFLPFMAR